MLCKDVELLCSNFRITTTCVTAQKWVSTHTLGSQGVKYLRSAILAWRTWMPAPLPLLHSEKMETSLNLNRACPPFLYLDSVFQKQNSILEGFGMGILKAKSLLLLLPSFLGPRAHTGKYAWQAQIMAERVLSIERVLPREDKENIFIYSNQPGQSFSHPLKEYFIPPASQGRNTFDTFRKY